MSFIRLGLFVLAVLLSVLCCQAAADNSTRGGQRSCPYRLKEARGGSAGVSTVLKKYESGLLLVLGFGGFSLLLAFLYNAARKYIFHDEHNLDSTFDAGGNVTFSLTAVTVASQLFWPGDMLHSATLTVKNGIAGPFWYATGVMFNIFIFPILSVNFKTRAPGAKTYLQIMKARFGKPTHIVFCFFALLTNLVITVGIILAGQATIQSLTENASDEFVIVVMAMLFGSYSFVGGLGTTFYVSYFNACLVFILLIIFVVRIFYVSGSEDQGLGSVQKVYDAVSCLEGPEGNVDNSYVTFRSTGALLYGVIEIFVSSAVTFCDQASWQSRIAAKPKQGVMGFILGGFMWFTIPTTMATTTGIGYLTLCYHNGSHLLQDGEITEGLVTPLIAERVLGSTGGIMILTMGAMALMSTGSGEVMAVSSIIVYDIYQTYFKPYREGVKHNQCVLCGRDKKPTFETKNASSARKDGKQTVYCECHYIADCETCTADVTARSLAKSNHKLKPNYSCEHHGRYREYLDSLIRFKNWCIIWVTISIIPLGLVVFESGIDLNWIFYEGAVVTVPCFPPVFLSIMWAKATGPGLIAGGISGLIAGIVVTLGMASTFPGGLGNFLINTAQDNTILAGIAAAFGFSLSVSVIVSFLTSKVKTADDEEMEWQKTQDIDNPLNPWEQNYQEELKGVQYEGKPSYHQMETCFRSAKILAYATGLISIGVFAIVIPCIMVIFPVMDGGVFKGWVTFCHIWAVIMAVIVIFFPPVEEVKKMMKQYKLNKLKEIAKRSQMKVENAANNSKNMELQVMLSDGSNQDGAKV